GLLLVLFHGWLFVGQVWAGELSDLTLVARWLISGGLVWGLYQFRRQGAPIFFGRKAVALWVLAALLHGPALAERIAAPGDPAIHDIVATVAQIASGAAVAVGLMLLTGLLSSTRRRTPTVFTVIRSDHAIEGALAPGTCFRFAPRPPPVV
ncbi:MAG TPA: hypothetical protein VLA20_03685, partial [Vicinamibacterales bacterium]|nr:hypothetical protein [Vicinamibacterales bacterium]